MVLCWAAGEYTHWTGKAKEVESSFSSRTVCELNQRKNNASTAGDSVISTRSVRRDSAKIDHHFIPFRNYVCCKP